jgi:hypothetical protein
MARPGLQKHPKFRRLVALLGVPVPHGVGYLECLWEVSYECGNPAIGDVFDVELAAQWPGERGKLCEALTNCGGDGRAGFIEQRGSPPANPSRPLARRTTLHLNEEGIRAWHA